MNEQSTDATDIPGAGSGANTAKFRSVLENAPVILFRLDGDGVFTELGGQAISKLGLDTEDIVGKSIFDAFSDSPEILDAAELALAGESVRHTAELDDLVFETEYRPVLENGDVLEVIGVSFDITDRMGYEQQLAENNAILEQLTGTTDDVFWLFDADFTEVLFVNDAYEEVWGRSIEALQKDPLDFMQGVHPDDRETLEQVIEKLQAGTPTEAEYRVNAAENFGRWVSVRGEPVFNEDGTVVRAAGYARDITDRKRTRQKLERRSAAIEKTADGIGIFDQDERLVYGNQAQADIYGYDSAEDLIGKTWRTFYEDDQIEWIESTVIPTLFEDGQWRGEVTGQRADGTSVPTELSLSVLPDGNLVGVVRKITQRKERERQLAALNDATKELSLARTPGDVAQTAVDIAAEVLEQPLTAMWRYDEEADSLRPWKASEESLTLAGASTPAEIGPIEPGTFEMSVLLKRPESNGSGAEAVVDIFDGTFEGEFAELAVPTAAG